MLLIKGRVTPNRHMPFSVFFSTLNLCRKMLEESKVLAYLKVVTFFKLSSIVL